MAFAAEITMGGRGVEKELVSLLLQDLPESISFILAAFALLRLRFDYKKIFMVAILQTFTNLIRLLPIAFGMHTVILLIALSIYVRIFTGAKLPKILSASTIVFVISAVIQVLYIQPLHNLTGFSYEQVAASPVLRGAFCLPYELVAVGLAVFLNRKSKRMAMFSNTTN